MDDGHSSTSTNSDIGWISYFLTLKGNEFFVEIDEDYIQDSFNLTGLSSQVPYYDYAIDLIIDIENEESHNLTQEHQEMIENDAEVLYGLIHARYILTNRGLHAMLEKYRHNSFGSCPRYSCNFQSVLPIGITDQKGKSPVKLYCPKCQEIYRPRSARHENIDGAAFGTTFANLFFLVFPEIKPPKNAAKYVPRVFGYKLHKTWHQRALKANKEEHQRYIEQQKKLNQRKQIINNDNNHNIPHNQ